MMYLWNVARRRSRPVWDCYPKEEFVPRYCYRTLGLFLSLIPLLANVQPALAQTDSRCFAATGFCIAGRIREFWEQNGGLPVFGYPISPQEEETIEGKTFQAQWFERTRLELHPENAPPYDVELGRIGVDRLNQEGRDWFTFPAGTQQPGCRYFPETQHTLCGLFLQAWHANGLQLNGGSSFTEDENLALFGMPISEPHTELIQGQPYTVQWFERVRMELHPENAPPYNVLFGLLGDEVRSNIPIAPGASPAPGSCNAPASVNATPHPGSCITPGTHLLVDLSGFAAHERISYWLTAPDKHVARTNQIGDSGNGTVQGLGLDTSDLGPGIWFWVFQGLSSHHSAILYIQVIGNLPPPVATPPSNATVTWTNPQNISTTRMRLFFPSVAVDASNVTHIVYTLS